MTNKTRENTYKRFARALALDAIWDWASRHANVAAYVAEVQGRLEEAANGRDGGPQDDGDLISEAVELACLIANEVREDSLDRFAGTSYKILLEAAAYEYIGLDPLA